MRKIFFFFSLIFFCFLNSSYADPENPTAEWLKTQTVNTLTQVHGYTLKFVTMTTEEDMQYTNYILTRPMSIIKKVRKEIVITCSYRGITFGHHCFLP